MITVEEIAQRDRTEEDVRVWLKTKSTQELGQFLASPWVASLLSPEGIEELYKEQEMITGEVIAQQDRTEEDLMAWLAAKSTQEFRQFLTSPWVASLLSDEAIEELSQELQQQEASPLEVGLD